MGALLSCRVVRVVAVFSLGIGLVSSAWTQQPPTQPRQREFRVAGFADDPNSVPSLPPDTPTRVSAEVDSRSDPMCHEVMRGDARLADVCFVDRLTGWAVGDRGTIWHTDDGGQQWQLQRSGVSCPLRSVWFLDRYTGWAAGGLTHPYTHTSSGVLLVTHDGGKIWQPIGEATLPALRRVRFFDHKAGWAVGCRSGHHPSGVLVTQDGGQNWRALSATTDQTWLAADMLDLHDGALAGRNGTTAMVRQRSITPGRTAPLGLRNLHRIQLVAPRFGWLIGDGGLVMMTEDLGTTWQTPPGELPMEVARHFDFAALSVVGPNAWIAGTPGTRVFRSTDAGRTWASFSTGQSVPIRGLSFVDPTHGWAVGDLGTILTTVDGGLTWHRQRCGGTRSAVLGLFGRPEDVPLELLAQLAGNEGYLSVVEIVNRRDVETPARSSVHPTDRLHEAVVAAGACGATAAWQFPLRQPNLGLGIEQIVEGLNHATDGRGIEQLQAHLVRQIRLWRPEILVTGDADGSRRRLVYDMVLRAVEEAADPTRFTEQISRAGLAPWKVKRVVATLPPGIKGELILTTAQLATRLGRSLGEVVSRGRGLVGDRFAPPVASLGFRVAVDRTGTDEASDFFSGISLHPGGEARRELLPFPPGGLRQMQRIAQRRRNTEAIVQRGQADPQGGVQLLAQTDELVRDLDARSAGDVIYHLAQSYYRNGRWDEAAQTFELFADRYPRHALAAPALEWLVQYYASGEAAWRIQGSQRSVNVRASAAEIPGERPYAVRQASALSIDLSQQIDRQQQAALFAQTIEQHMPALYAEPMIRFPLAAADRARGYGRQADRYYMTRRYGALHDAWWECAKGEQWLARPEGTPPKPVFRCAIAAAKPLLDGKLDEPVWQQAQAARLQSTAGDDHRWPAEVMMAYDAEFLYLAVRCRQAPGAHYRPGVGPRSRDADLTASDRIDLFLDLDRDWATYYRFSLDSRGWTSEGCWGDTSWNPTWFVAADTSEGSWTAEVAIPLDQLTGNYPQSRHAWAVGLQRTVPGVGFQSWSRPAATEVVPEGFGLLIFQ